MRRREFVVSVVSVSTAMAATSGCSFRFPNKQTPPPDIISDLIDAHCHIFNGCDIPSVRFIKVVVAKNYPKQAVRVLDIEDPDALDQLISLLTWFIGRTRSPTASAEIRVLDGQAMAEARNADLAANQDAVVDALAEVVANGGLAVAGGMPSTGKIRSAILRAAGETGTAVSTEQMGTDAARVVAKKAFLSKVDLGVLLRWFALFTRYRYVLAEQLVADHRREGFQARLLCPALVDFDYWLGQYLDTSPLPDQVRVMGRIARRKSGPVVHGYVAFDPLRQIAFEAGERTGFNPIELVKSAIADEGFLGVKLYPPMGFRAIGNGSDPCQTYEDSPIIRKLAGQAADDPLTAACLPRPIDGSRAIGQKLDAALSSLYQFCTQADVCVMAHANESNGASKGSEHRADPAYWIDVFKQWPTLHVTLAHFGSFSARSVASDANAQMPDGSWEWALGKYLLQNPGAPVFAHVSYMTEIVGLTPQAQQAYISVFQRWLSTFDPECNHLTFGTDWVMQGIETSYPDYTKRIYDFFSRALRFDRPKLQRLFVGNATRFLGLCEGDPSRDRLLRFYDLHGIPRSRLPSFGHD